MSDDDQTYLPRSFLELYIEPGRIKPHASRTHIHERYEYCEDLAQSLVETARTKEWELGVSRDDVLERIGRGLDGGGAGVEASEARWVMVRLKELLGDLDFYN